MADKSKKSQYSIRNSLTNYYLLLMFTVFPLFLTQQYAHARRDKLWFFLVLSGILLLSVTATSAITYFEERRLGTVRPILRPFTAPDIAFCSFFLAAAISTLISDYRLDSLTGNAGRNNGLILLLTYMVVYLIVTRFWYYKSYVIVGYLVGSAIVALLAVLNFFYIDPLGIFEGYSERVIEDFGSTIGNKNTISSFMCLFLPLTLALFVLARKRYLKVLSGIGIALAYTGLLCADSSSGFLGLVAVLCAVAVVAARSYDTLCSYALGLTILFSSAKLLRLFSILMDDKHKTMETIPQALVYSPLSYLPIVLSAVLFIVLLLLRGRLSERYRSRPVRIVLLSVIAALFLLLLGAFVYFSVFDTGTELGSLSRMLRFDERWGTHRGYMWMKGMEDYPGFDLLHKLFGSGPDTFYHVFAPHFGELLEKFGDSSTDCIHSEYLNYLITQGIIGLIAYLSLLVTACVRMAKNGSRCALTLVFLCAVIGYAAQATVNIYQPITTPVMILFLSMGEALCRKSDDELSMVRI